MHFAKVVAEIRFGSAFPARINISLDPAGPTVFGKTVITLKE